MENKQIIVNRIFRAQGSNGCWKMLPESDKHYPTCLHYNPNFKATLWTLILLADIEIDRNDPRVKEPLNVINNHFYDPDKHVYSLKEDHFPIPCLNGNILYLDSFFNNGQLSLESLTVVDFFSSYQRFDDGEYVLPKNEYCSNKSCYGKHTCYWGIIKLFKGLSFIPESLRTDSMRSLLAKCIQFVLLHNVCYRSRDTNKLIINKIDKLTFPNMYKSDFLEILWLLKREGVKSERIDQAVDLLKSKRLINGDWNLERKVNNMITTIGDVNETNPFIIQRASEVLDYYDD